VVVESVDPYGEASARALQQNDVILSVSDVQITSVKQIEKIINELKAGDAILLRVKRTDKTLVFIALEMPR
jgi:S1-C subfamily serine protease